MEAQLHSLSKVLAVLRVFSSVRTVYVAGANGHLEMKSTETKLIAE